MAGRISYLGGITRSGLLLDLDAAKLDSYPKAGNTWFDISGNQVNGTLTNSPTFNSGNYGHFKFDGTNQYINLGATNLGILAGSNQITLESWVYPTVFASYRGIISRVGSSGPFGGWMINLNADSGNKFDLAINLNGVWQTWVTLGGTFPSPLTTNTWYNVCGTYDGSGMSMYINGSLISTKSVSGTIQYAVSMSNLGVGYNGAGTYFPGLISVARVYNKSLSSVEVLQNYNALKGRYGL